MCRRRWLLYSATASARDVWHGARAVLQGTHIKMADQEGRVLAELQSGRSRAPPAHSALPFVDLEVLCAFYAFAVPAFRRNNAVK